MDNELKAQTIRTVIGTNKGEWPLNKNEGINFDYVLGKGITDDMIMTQIIDGMRQVDETLYLDNLNVQRIRTVEKTVIFRHPILKIIL